MRMNSIIILVVAIIFGLSAVAAARSYLQQQRAAMGENNGAQGNIVVAAKAMRFGALVETGDLKEIPWAASELPAGAFQRISDIISDEGKRYTLSTITPNEPIIDSKITKPGQRATLSTTLSEGMKAVTIRVNDVLGVAGFVLPGDTVDVMLTRSRRSAAGAEEPYVDVLLQGVRVLAIDQLANEQRDQPSVVKSVTFEVTTEHAQKLALGSQVGTLSLALRNTGNDAPEAVRRISVTDLETDSTEAERLRQRLSTAEAERVAAEKAREEALRRVESMFKDRTEPLTPEILNAEIEKQLKLMETRIREEMASQKRPEPVRVEGPRSLRVGVSRGAKRTEYTLDD